MPTPDAVTAGRSRSAASTRGPTPGAVTGRRAWTAARRPSGSGSASRSPRSSSTGCANRRFDAGRGDFFYLADAFLHGRTWLDVAASAPYDVIYVDGHVYVPFAPFPAIVLMPLVAIVGAVTADQWESGINAVLAAIGRRARAGGSPAGSASRACATGSRLRPAAGLRDPDLVGDDPRRRVAHRPPRRDRS